MPVTRGLLVTFDLPVPYPHGFVVSNGIERALASNTLRCAALGDPGETIAVNEASTAFEGMGKASKRQAAAIDAGQLETGPRSGCS